MFQPDSAHGISPFEAFPARRVARHFRTAAAPACRYPTDPRPLHAAGSRHRQPRLPGFDPDERPWPTHPLFTGGELDAPLGFAPSKALPPLSTPDESLRQAPLTRFLAAKRHRRPRVLMLTRLIRLARPQPEGQRHATQTTLMGFARRRHPQSSRRTRSGLMGSPHGRRAVTGLPCPVPRTTHAALPQPLAWR